MELPEAPPIRPMLAKLARELPVGDGWLYEPKWDGFRCLVFRDGDAIELHSRNGRPLARYFPELVEAFGSLAAKAFVLDGEILVSTADGVDFGALLARVHPAASRVERLRRETPASFVAFDLVRADGDDLCDAAFARRRSRLVELLADAPACVFTTPCTDDPELAQAWLEEHRRGIDGVVAKEAHSRYEPNKRVMVKVKRERTVDCVVAGFRWALDRPVVASLLLGLYDAARALQHVGVASSFREDDRLEMVEFLRPYATELEGHPWGRGFIFGGNPTGRLKGSASRWTPAMPLDWVPLRPELVCEVAYSQLDVDRFRHPARFLRWRPDRDAPTCTFEQLAVAA